MERPEGITDEQWAFVQKYRAEIEQKMPAKVRPKWYYEVFCLTCGAKGRGQFFEMISDEEIHMALLLQGWTIFRKGYECPRCSAGWRNAT